MPLCVQRTYVVVCVVGGGVVVTAICTSKSELEFNVLSARRYVSMAQRNAWWGGDWNRRWGQTTARRQSKSISEYASRRIQEILPGLGEGEEDLATPFNNAPDRLFNTYIFIIVVSTPSERGGFDLYLNHKTLHLKSFLFCFPLHRQFVSNLVLTLCVRFSMYSYL